MKKSSIDLKPISLSVIKSGDEVLIVRRYAEEEGYDGKKLRWAFPGGIVLEDETDRETAVRETLEETGYQVEALSLISEREHPQYPVYVKYHECRITSPETTDLIDVHEIAQVSWVKIEKLLEYFETDLDRKVAKFLGL